MNWTDDEFQAWLRRQNVDALDADIALYGTPALTAIMTMVGYAPPERGGPRLTETVIVSGYVAANMVTLTYPRVELNDPDIITLGGVVREIPVPRRDGALGEIFAREIGRLIDAGWIGVTPGELA